MYIKLHTAWRPSNKKKKGFAGSTGSEKIVNSKFDNWKH